MSYAVRRLKLRRPELGPAVALRGEPRAEVAEVDVAGQGVVLLHHRRPQIAIGPAGVTVLDVKRYPGRIAVEHRGGLLQQHTEHLVVGGRDCTELVDGVLAEAAAVREVLADSPRPVPVRALLCFVDGDWPWSGRLEVRGVPLVDPRRAAKLCATGDLPAEAVTAIETVLNARLAPA